MSPIAQNRRKCGGSAIAVAPLRDVWEILYHRPLPLLGDDGGLCAARRSAIGGASDAEKRRDNECEQGGATGFSPSSHCGFIAHSVVISRFGCASHCRFLLAIATPDADPRGLFAQAWRPRRIEHDACRGELEHCPP